MKNTIIILSIVIVAMGAAWYYSMKKDPLPVQTIQPVVVENLSKVDSLQKQCAIRDSQLLKIGNTCFLLYAKNGDLKLRLKQSDTEVDTLRARYDRNHTLEQCDSLVTAQQYNIQKKDSAITQLDSTITTQKTTLFLLKQNNSDKDSAISLLKQSVATMTTDITALNYYRTWCNDHPFKRWFIGIKRK
jgi:predicted RNase H-like nuclease (RuvC/YqgF family)